MERYKWNASVNDGILAIKNTQTNQNLNSLELTKSIYQLVSIENLGLFDYTYSGLSSEWKERYIDEFNQLTPEEREQFTIKLVNISINNYLFVCINESNVLDILK